jgi:hypothetical protein
METPALPARAQGSGCAAPWVCVVCLEPLRCAAAAAHAGGVVSDDALFAVTVLSSALPAELPCHHGCCGACLAQYMRTAVPRAAREAALSGTRLHVLCPGTRPAGAAQAGRDPRCQTALPPALLARFIPPPAPAAHHGAAAARGDDANEDDAAPVDAGCVRRVLGAARTRWYLLRRTRACPSCGVSCQLASGCRHVTCAACGLPWCFDCGRRMPCRCSYDVRLNESGPVNRAINWASDAPSRANAALRWALALLYIVLVAGALRFVLLAALAALALLALAAALLVALVADVCIAAWVLVRDAYGGAAARLAACWRAPRSGGCDAV